MASWCDSMAAPPRVLVAPGPSDSNAEGNVISLQHPKSGEQACYLFMDSQLHELNWFKQCFGSWFLGNYVCEDGSLYFCTPVDPIFILLPIFEAARMVNGKNPGKFRQLDEILYVEGCPGYQHLMSIAEHHMQMVCEVKEVANMKFFRLDDSKVLSWLCCKVNHLKEILPKLGKNYAAQGEKELLKEVIQIFREYLKDEPWLMLLCKKLQLNINEIVATAKTSEALFFAESSPMPARPSEGNVGNGSAKSSKGKAVKKQKTEVESKNIKDMFRRVTRSGT